MNLNEVMVTLFSWFPWGFLKVSIIVVLIIYIIFAAIIVRQEQLMSKVVDAPSSVLLRTAALLHLIASFVILFLAIVLL